MLAGRFVTGKVEGLSGRNLKQIINEVQSIVNSEL